MLHYSSNQLLQYVTVREHVYRNHTLSGICETISLVFRMFWRDVLDWVMLVFIMVTFNIDSRDMQHYAFLALSKYILLHLV